GGVNCTGVTKTVRLPDAVSYRMMDESSTVVYAAPFSIHRAGPNCLTLNSSLSKIRRRFRSRLSDAANSTGKSRHKADRIMEHPAQATTCFRSDSVRTSRLATPKARRGAWAGPRRYDSRRERSQTPKARRNGGGRETTARPVRGEPDGPHRHA